MKKKCLYISFFLMVTKTFGEMTAEEKNVISIRRLALEKLKMWVKYVARILECEKRN